MRMVPPVVPMAVRVLFAFDIPCRRRVPTGRGTLALTSPGTLTVKCDHVRRPDERRK
jgi:hypothetical protein